MGLVGLRRAGIVVHPAEVLHPDDPAASETSDRSGRSAAGTFWFYNNWDFNARGTIYRQATGEDIFRSFARRVAGPIGMEVGEILRRLHGGAAFETVAGSVTVLGDVEAVAAAAPYIYGYVERRALVR